MTNSTRKFEVTQFYPSTLGAKWFVKLGSAPFTKPELSAIQKLRQHLNRLYPQRKTTENPASWRLTIETIKDDYMTGRLSVLTPAHRHLDWTQFGSVEYICDSFHRMLEIPSAEQ